MTIITSVIMKILLKDTDEVGQYVLVSLFIWPIAIPLLSIQGIYFLIVWTVKKLFNLYENTL